MVTERYLPHFFRSYFSAKSLEPPLGFRTTADRQDHVEHTEAQAGTVTPGLFSETMHSSDATTRRPLMLDLW